ncbi:hypothetical protein [Hallella multisaccharivorax]|uniref:hypothetical protein n=1 Tax=Hallella multisaccharivorax TaxID=310514 RepID=UPI0012EA66FE|nr:hypothetical protein [Hallella multisaccharivorax]
MSKLTSLWSCFCLLLHSITAALSASTLAGHWLTSFFYLCLSVSDEILIVMVQVIKPFIASYRGIPVLPGKAKYLL